MATSSIDIENMVDRVINWHRLRYPQLESNTPSKESLIAIQRLSKEVLIPVQNQFGVMEVTYGFTSPRLLSLIKKANNYGIAPSLDQHASHEVNSKENPHCVRFGAACDFIIADYKAEMHQVADWISLNLNFDRLYFYGPNRPLHISSGPENSKFIQIMGTSTTGKRVPMQRGANVSFSKIWEV